MHSPATGTEYITQQELAKRWGRSEAVISLHSAVGAGPSYLKIGGRVRQWADVVKLHLATSHPGQALWHLLAAAFPPL